MARAGAEVMRAWLKLCKTRLERGRGEGHFHPPHRRRRLGRRFGRRQRPGPDPFVRRRHRRRRLHAVYRRRAGRGGARRGLGQDRNRLDRIHGRFRQPVLRLQRIRRGRPGVSDDRRLTLDPSLRFQPRQAPGQLVRPPRPGVHFEAIIAPGDSGGASLVYVDGEWYLVSVDSFLGCLSPGCSTDSGFGDYAGDVSVYVQLD